MKWRVNMGDGNPVRFLVGLAALVIGGIFWLASLTTNAYTGWDLDSFHPEGAELIESFGWISVFFVCVALPIFWVSKLRAHPFYFLMISLSGFLLVTVLARIAWVYSITP